MPGKHYLNAVLRAFLAARTRGMRSELEARKAQRGGNGWQWFTPEEAETADALANIIIPSDEESPGIEDVCVLGPAAMESLDKLVASHPGRQGLYASGLWSFDRWAMDEHGSRFAAISKENQTDLFRKAYRLHHDWSGGARLTRRLWLTLRTVARAERGLYYSAKLYPMIRNDCLRIFYTSRVSWTWLEYDGPPMDVGYPDLRPRQEEVRSVTRG